MKVTFVGNEVEYLYKAGNDYVRATMNREDAENIVAKGKPKEVDVQGFNVQVGNYFFKNESTSSKITRKSGIYNDIS
jgi:hypothetical protein